MLSGNFISTLPKEISNCTNLELVRLSSNRLVEPPMDLLRLPNLAWVALSENPFLSQRNHINACHDDNDDDDDDDDDERNENSSSLEILPYDDLDDPSKGEILGKGASGITRKYTIQQREVAVKEFYSNITSDGNPFIERRISFTTATKIQSKSLIQVLGQTKKGNLVMELLSNYEVLANPPSLQSCSRDTYDHYDTKDEDVNENDVNDDDDDDDDNNNNNKQSMKSYVTYKRIISLVHHLLYTLKELHTKCNITHGDFYGHNILFSKKDESQIWLTDFGAAFFYDRQSEYGKWIELIEKRAFCHLLGELNQLMDKYMVRCSSSSSSSSSNREGEEGMIQELKNAIEKMIDSKEECTFEQLYVQWNEFYSHRP